VRRSQRRKVSAFLEIFRNSFPRPPVFVAIFRLRADLFLFGPSIGSGGGSSASRGPGAAPLRMETGDQRKFGYGGDGAPPDDGDDDGDGWEPGGEGEPSPLGLFVLLAAGAWALWEYRRPGGTLNPQTKRDIERRRYEAQLASRKKRLQQARGGGTGKVNVG